MHPPTTHRYLEVEQVGDAIVVRFTVPWILKEGTIETIGETLDGLVENSSCRKFVLNFDNVKSLTSMMYGKLVGLHKKIEDAGGRLALCKINPNLYEVFEVLNLTPTLTIYGEEQEALQSL
jgi:stage II sporulation protein AA (anti-sigma F factor antagonist)